MDSSEYLDQKIDERDLEVPRIGVILGSGIGQITEDMVIQLEVWYDEVPGIKSSTVEGHKGRFIIGEVGNTMVVCMDGRLHYYETGDIDQVVKPIKAMCELGFEKLLITNAAGGVNDKYEPGDVMILEDHINMMGTNPLISRSEDYPGEMFPDQTNAYDPKLIDQAKTLSSQHDLNIQKGVYVAMTGPTYETPAEVNMINSFGGDAIGMSTVPECIVANQYGIDVFAVSTITNYAAGISDEPLSHEEVIETIEDIKPELTSFMRRLINKI